MNLALASSVLGAGAGSAPTPPLDITTLALTGLWRAPYGGPPWASTASAGTSGGAGRSMVSLGAASDPAVGPPIIDALTPAVYSSGKRLRNNTLTADSFISRTAYRVSCMFVVTTLAAASDPVYFAPGLLVDNQGVFGLTLDEAGVHFYHSSGSFVYAHGPGVPSLDDLHVADVMFDGTAITVSLDGDPGTPVLAGTLDALTSSTLLLGANLFSTSLTGSLGDTFVSDVSLSDVDPARMLTYYADRYGL